MAGKAELHVRAGDENLRVRAAGDGILRTDNAGGEVLLTRGYPAGHGSSPLMLLLAISSRDGFGPWMLLWEKL